MFHRIIQWEYSPRPLGKGYSGPETYEESTHSITTADGQVSLGAWRYEGALQSDLTMQSHQIWVVTQGRAHVLHDGAEAHLIPGSVICFEAPYGPKIVQASEGFAAVWIAVLGKRS